VAFPFHPGDFNQSAWSQIEKTMVQWFTSVPQTRDHNKIMGLYVRCIWLRYVTCLYTFLWYSLPWI